MDYDFSELSTYLIVKRYLSQPDKYLPEAIELEKAIRANLNYNDEVDFSSFEVRDRLSKIVRKEKEKIEKFINITSWIVIILLGISFINRISTLISDPIASRFNNKINSLYSENINPIAKFIIENQTTITIVSILLIILMLIVSVGVLRRSNLARKLAIVFLAYKIIQNFLEPIMVKFVYPSLHDLKIDVPKSIADSMYQTSVVFSVLISVVFILLYGWLIYKFTSQEITEEFK